MDALNEVSTQWKAFRKEALANLSLVSTICVHTIYVLVYLPEKGRERVHVSEEVSERSTCIKYNKI